MMTTTAADLGAAHLNRCISISGHTSDQRRWSLTGRLTAVSHAATPDDEGSRGLRSAELAVAVGDASITVDLEPDHPVVFED